MLSHGRRSSDLPLPHHLRRAGLDQAAQRGHREEVVPAGLLLQAQAELPRGPGAPAQRLQAWGQRPPRRARGPPGSTIIEILKDLRAAGVPLNVSISRGVILGVLEQGLKTQVVENPWGLKTHGWARAARARDGHGHGMGTGGWVLVHGDGARGIGF
jgi:hypothetical protein